jgi:hypothetical protein
MRTILLLNVMILGCGGGQSVADLGSQPDLSLRADLATEERQDLSQSADLQSSPDLVAFTITGCDTTQGGSHRCTDSAFMPDATFQAQLESTCSITGGTVQPSCSQTGIIGSCRTTDHSGPGGTLIYYATWFYTGNVTTLMTSCAASHGTWSGP